MEGYVAGNVMKNKFFKALAATTLIAGLFAFEIHEQVNADGTKAAEISNLMIDFTATGAYSCDNYGEKSFSDITMEGVNTNNATWGFARIGGKNSNNSDFISSIITNDPVSQPIGEITMDFANFASNSKYKLEQLTLQVDDALFDVSKAGYLDEGGLIDTISFSNSQLLNDFSDCVVTFTPSSLEYWPEKSYYRFTVEFTNNSTDRNYGADLEKITFTPAVPPSEQVPVEKVDIISEDEIVLNVLDEMTLTAAVEPTNATNKTILWESTEPDIVSVDQSGKISALKAGESIISATSKENPEIYDIVNVTVKPLELGIVSSYSTIISYDEVNPESEKSDPYLFVDDESNLAVYMDGVYKPDSYDEIKADRDAVISNESVNNAPSSIKSLTVVGYGNGDNYGYYAPTVKIGGEIVNYKRSSERFVYTPSNLDNDGSFHIEFDNGFTYFDSIEIEFVTPTDTALDFAKLFNEWMDLACDVSGQVPPDAETWSFLKEEFMALDASTQSLLRDGSAVQGGDEIEDALWLYDYVVGKYNPSFDPDSSYDDWMGRKPGPQSAYVGVASTDGLNPTIVAAVGLGALALLPGIGFAFYKKRREA